MCPLVKTLILAMTLNRDKPCLPRPPIYKPKRSAIKDATTMLLVQDFGVIAIADTSPTRIVVTSNVLTVERDPGHP